MSTPQCSTPPAEAPTLLKSQTNLEQLESSDLSGMKISTTLQRRITMPTSKATLGQETQHDNLVETLTTEALTSALEGKPADNIVRLDAEGYYELALTLEGAFRQA